MENNEILAPWEGDDELGIGNSTTEVQPVKQKIPKFSKRKWPADDLDREFQKFVRDCCQIPKSSGI